MTPEQVAATLDGLERRVILTGTLPAEAILALVRIVRRQEIELREARGHGDARPAGSGGGRRVH